MDKITKEQRRKTMQAVKGSKTRLENSVSKTLFQRGTRFRKNERSLKGTPDISIKKYKVVIFLDSCFWHGCELHCRMPKSNKKFWSEKITRNRERDKEVTDYYLSKGWNVLRVWEHELVEDFDETIEKIIHFINKAKEEP